MGVQEWCAKHEDDAWFVFARKYGVPLFLAFFGACITLLTVGLLRSKYPETISYSRLQISVGGQPAIVAPPKLQAWLENNENSGDNPACEAGNFGAPISADSAAPTKMAKCSFSGGQNNCAYKLRLVAAQAGHSFMCDCPDDRQYTNGTLCCADATSGKDCQPRSARPIKKLAVGSNLGLLLIKRGQCSFGQKYRNAEKAGYGGAIVVDQRRGDSTSCPQGMCSRIGDTFVGGADGAQVTELTTVLCNYAAGQRLRAAMQAAQRAAAAKRSCSAREAQLFCGDATVSMWKKSLDCPAMPGFGSDKNGKGYWCNRMSPTRELDSSILVLAFIASATVFFGSLASKNEFMEQRKRNVLARAERLAREAAAVEAGEEPEEPRGGGGGGQAANGMMMINSKMAIGYVIFGSCMLLGFYALIKYCITGWLTVFNWWFAVATGSVLYTVLSVPLRKRFPTPHVEFDLDLKLFHLKVSQPASTLACMAFCFCFSVLGWGMHRSEDWVWWMQDMLCINLCAYIMTMFILPDAKVSFTLLTGMFLYDVFWVYISPFLVQAFSSEPVTADTGSSVMVAVAKGESSDCGSASLSPESLPVVIRWPRQGTFLHPTASAMLGLGDIILPAFFIAFVMRYDVLSGRVWQLPRFGSSAVVNAASGDGVGSADEQRMRSMLYGYFVPSFVGYIIALLMAYVVVSKTGLAQPALLYIVPVSCWATLLLAWRRGQLLLLWEGRGRRIGRSAAPGGEGMGGSLMAGDQLSQQPDSGSTAL